jgi:hypothetical protein
MHLQPLLYILLMRKPDGRCKNMAYIIILAELLAQTLGQESFVP